MDRQNGVLMGRGKRGEREGIEREGGDDTLTRVDYETLTGTL